MKTSLIIIVIIAAFLCISPSSAVREYNPTNQNPSSSPSSTGNNPYSISQSGSLGQANNWPGSGSTSPLDIGSSDYMAIGDSQKNVWTALLNYEPEAGASSYSKNPTLNLLVKNCREELKKLAQMSQNDPFPRYQIEALANMLTYTECVARLSGMTDDECKKLRSDLMNYYTFECKGNPRYVDEIYKAIAGQ